MPAAAPQACSMPGSAAGEFLALQQDHIAAELGQVIGDRAADDAATDDKTGRSISVACIGGARLCSMRDLSLGC